MAESSPEKKLIPVEEGILVTAERRQSIGGVSKKMKIIIHSTESEKSEVIPGDVSSDDECSPQTFDFEEDLTEFEKSKGWGYHEDYEELCPIYTRLARECEYHQFRRYSLRIGWQGRHKDSDELARESEDYQSWRNHLILDALRPGALAEHLEDFDKLFPIFMHQATESEGYDIDDFPGHVIGAITPIWWLKLKRMREQMMELDKWAICEYNEKKRNGAMAAIKAGGGRFAKPNVPKCCFC